MDVKMSRLTFARFFIFIVIFFNMQCAAAFLLDPEAYTFAFEVSGVPGATLVRSLGLLFVMWNVPYLVALLHPVRHRISLYEAVAMQAIGLTGESILLLNLPTGHAALQATAVRFILFDASGMVFLLLAVILTRIIPKNDGD